MRPLIPAFVLCAACSSSSTASTPPEPNPCAIKGATYTETLTLQTGLGCAVAVDDAGKSSQQVIVSASGAVSTSAYGVSASCNMSTTSGCTTTNSDCSYSASDQTCTLYTELTFADGGTLTGTETVECTNGAGNSCMAAYKATGVQSSTP